MALTFGPNLGLLVNGAQGEAHYSDLMKQWRSVDGLVQARVLDKDLTAPPGSPADGDQYVVGAGATGAWSGHSGKVARYSTVAAAWEFYTPKSGWRVYVVDEGVSYQYAGAAWTSRVAFGSIVLGTDPDASGTQLLRVGGKVLVGDTPIPAGVTAPYIGLTDNAGTDGPLVSLFGAVATPGFVGYRSGTSVSAPSATGSGVNLFAFSGRSYDGTNWSGTNIGLLLQTTQAHTPSAQGTRLVIRTTANGSTTVTNRWAFEQDGSIVPFAANSYDIGTASNTARTGYFGTSVATSAFG